MTVSWKVLDGDCRDVLRSLPDRSVHTVVTSPPYFGLRDYGTGEWDGGDPDCSHRREDAVQSGSSTLGVPAGGGPRAIGSDNATVVHKQVFRDACRLCGATRTDRQIGLEPSPDEFVQALVEVFREVRRVLRDDGTVWLVLGDSYAAQGGSKAANTYEGKRVSDADWQPARRPADGLKPKDLIGIPWKVAEALKAPYYIGTIKDERDRIWLAAMIDAEGCMFIHKRKVGQSNGQGYVRKNDSYGAGLEISSTDRVIVENIARITGRGSICSQSPEQNERRKQTIYRWNLRSNECRDVIREVYPHLVAKQHEARLVLGCPSSGAAAERAHESLKAIHQGGTPGIDFAPPASMFEGGWCLRSDVIWAKLAEPDAGVRDGPPDEIP